MCFDHVCEPAPYLWQLGSVESFLIVLFIAWLSYLCCLYFHFWLMLRCLWKLRIKSRMCRWLCGQYFLYQQSLKEPHRSYYENLFFSVPFYSFIYVFFLWLNLFCANEILWKLTTVVLSWSLRCRSFIGITVDEHSAINCRAHSHVHLHVSSFSLKQLISHTNEVWFKPKTKPTENVVVAVEFCCSFGGLNGKPFFSLFFFLSSYFVNLLIIIKKDKIF